MSNNKFLIYIKSICVIAIASFLFSCTPSAVNLEKLDPNLYDQSWLTGKPCSVPCWYGLEPGVSSRQDSISTAKQLPFINANGVALNNLVGASFLCEKPQDLNCVDMAFDNNILETLWFVPNFKITFEQAVEKLGVPDLFSITSMYYPDAGGCELRVVWKNKRLVLEYATGMIGIFSFGKALDEELCQQNEGNLPLPKGILVQYVEITIPSDIEAIINNSKPWKGFADK